MILRNKLSDPIMDSMTREEAEALMFKGPNGDIERRGCEVCGAPTSKTKFEFHYRRCFKCRDSVPTPKCFACKKNMSLDQRSRGYITCAGCSGVCVNFPCAGCGKMINQCSWASLCPKCFKKEKIAAAAEDLMHRTMESNSQTSSS